MIHRYTAPQLIVYKWSLQTNEQNSSRSLRHTWKGTKLAFQDSFRLQVKKEPRSEVMQPASCNMLLLFIEEFRLKSVTWLLILMSFYTTVILDRLHVS